MNTGTAGVGVADADASVGDGVIPELGRVETSAAAPAASPAAEPFVARFSELGDRYWSLNTPDGAVTFRSKTRGRRLIRNLRATNVITVDQATELYGLLNDFDDLYDEELQPARFKMCSCPKNHGHLNVGRDKHEIFSKQQARLLFEDQERDDSLYQDLEAARLAVADSSLPNLTEEEKVEIKPAHVAMDKTSACPVRNGELLAFGTKPLGRFFSRAKALELLCTAVTDGVISENDRPRIEEEIAALDLPVEISDSDRLYHYMLPMISPGISVIAGSGLDSLGKMFSGLRDSAAGMMPEGLLEALTSIAQSGRRGRRG